MFIFSLENNGKVEKTAQGEREVKGVKGGSLTPFMFVAVYRLDYQLVNFLLLLLPGDCINIQVDIKGY